MLTVRLFVLTVIDVLLYVNLTDVPSCAVRESAVPLIGLADMLSPKFARVTSAVDKSSYASLAVSPANVRFSPWTYDSFAGWRRF